VLAAVSILSVLDAPPLVGVTGLLVKIAVTPDGRPLTANVTAEL
jgi:hypothetical protein